MTDPVRLPPLETAVPSYLAKAVDTYSGVPVVDISWAVQCFVDQKLLPFADKDKSGRFGKIDIYADNIDKRIIYCVKRKDGVRFEVGDIVQVKNRDKNILARIESFSDGSQATVQVLEHQPDRKLIDGGSINTPPSFVNVHVNDIDKHILLFKGKDFREIEHTYGRNEELVFVQKRKFAPRKQSFTFRTISRSVKTNIP